MRSRVAAIMVCVVCVVCVVCGVGGIAHADRADQLFKKGKKLLAEKKYPEACTAFEESDNLDPGIGAKLNVARCYQEWGKLATAWRWFADAEQMATDTKDDRARKIHALLDEIDASVPRLTVKVPRNATTGGVVVKLDGAPLDTSALGVERRVDPGPHQIDYLVNGVKRTKVVPVERGGSAEVTLDLPGPSLRPTPVSPPAVAESSDDSDSTRHIIGLGVTGAGVVAMGIAGIVTYRARSDYRYALSTHCRGDKLMCDDKGLSVTHGALHRANIATIVTIGGLVTVAGGLLLFFTEPAVAPHRNEHALYLAPSLDAGGASVVFGGAL
ncbi:MAG TPA: hypothetical protein VHN14_33705 [Kofleriaceae bacterium]|jgi:hypothetical protein|nr:hypothetical protein [Kofleriaceae bacterium]